MNMVLLRLLIFTLTFYELVVDLDAKICPKGHRIIPNKGCAICLNGYYQPDENDSQYCRVCTKCAAQTGSVVKENCTKVTDTKCQCRGEFVPREKDSSTCKCDTGFGLKLGECSKCEDGYFSTQINSPCQKWKECKCGVNRTGSRTSDVICNELKRCSDESTTYITTPPTSNKIVFLMTHSTSHRPHEGAQTQRTHRPSTTTITTTTTSTAAPGHTVNIGQPLHTPDAGATYIGTGTALVIFVITGLLVVLTTVTCKLHITRQPALPKNDSLCRRPVEESGDGDGSLSSLKLNPEEH